MTEARAAALRIGAGASRLTEAHSIAEDASGRPEGHPGEFDDGQLSGPSGPRFVGFGVPVLRPLWRDLAENLAFGLGVGAAIFMLIRIL